MKSLPAGQFKNIIFILIMYSIIGFTRELLAPSAENISGSYSTGQSQIISTAVIVLTSLVLFYLTKTRFRKIYSFYLPFVIFFLYGIFTSLWSPNMIKSLVLASLNFTDLIWAVAIGKMSQQYSASKRFEYFLLGWSLICIADFILSASFKGFPPNLDEIALISFLLAFLLHHEYQYKALPILLLMVGLFGSSVSAIVSFLLALLLFYSQNSKRKFIFLLVIIVPSAIFVYQQMLNGSLTLFGKGLDVLLTGSGRIGAYQVVYNSIINAPVANILFGHGYASDRIALEAAELSWTVDVHNNILHISYGLGLVGLCLFLYSCVYCLNSKASFLFTEYRYFVFIGLMCFGLTSSYFFGRPSYSAIFWLSFATSTYSFANLNLKNA